ncbi:HNH endonuclease [Streptomyces bacillaris]|uniref:HNH endonuclease n=1 Tax=Streptomyces bacillaris TaxID=68179 RepID=UPI0034614E52
MPAWLASGRTVGVPAVASVVDARNMRSRREGALGRFGVGMKSVMSLSTGAGKTATAVAVAIEMARQGKRLTVVVKDRAEQEAAEAQLMAAWAGLEEAADDQTAPDSFRLAPEPYAPRRLRARSTPVAVYRALCMRAAEREQSGRDQERRAVAGDRRVRNPAARRAVVIRSGGRCENPECLLPDLPYRTKAGEPMLEVDHIDDHAGGGRDHPAAMIAVCPNCHSNKTHGAERDALTELLRNVAAERHAIWAASVT